MSSIHEHTQPPAETWPEQAGLQSVAEAGASNNGPQSAEGWISVIETVMSVATLPLIMIVGAFVLLNILCLAWNIVFHLNRRLLRGTVDGPNRRASLGCRWGAETLPSLDNRTIWVCADCGATTQADMSRPPTNCQQRPAVLPSAPRHPMGLHNAETSRV